ncbi:NADPH-dependent 2,4-dienoyl-CoA reductase [Kocuria palustris]|uniref:NADPH-dependent 2,4-dienoyl-CoA reductase n=1 Tax=Kocuria palustris TaxID=71999 RepID=UPI00119D0E9F|nr:NADPH-dependent 2,4-dienoyl-CoA reductase [Kocuria palustris]
MSAHPRLSEPLAIGSLTLPHRILMGSMHTGMEDDPEQFPELAAFFAERARGGAGLMITGGFSPNDDGRLTPDGGQLSDPARVPEHRIITDAVHGAGGLIAVQLLHAGRYAYHPGAVSASATQSPISPFPARELDDAGVRRTIEDFARAAVLAQEAGYDAVEIMGSEGYLLNQFLAAHTNQRDDEWGGDARRRRRLPVEVVRAVRAAVPDLPIIYRISLMDLVDGGQSWADVAALARELEAAGVSAFNTGIGWHEARVPTIVTSVPRAAFVRATAALKSEVSVPVAASNRISMPETAEQILAAGQADLVSMARPFLADPAWVRKAVEGRDDEINTCIACNQACLDHTFSQRRASCLVNPRAGRETSLVLGPTRTAERIAVIGAGPAGLASAAAAAERGHHVELFEAQDHLGGQFALAQRIPGKEEFAETLRYFTRRLEDLGVAVHTGRRVGAQELIDGGWDHVVLATGVEPRVPEIDGLDHPSVIPYPELISGRRSAGERVAVIGAGGIGVDVCEYLTHAGPQPTPVEQWQREWGVAPLTGPEAQIGALRRPEPQAAARQVHLIQRRTTKIGKDLGPTTSWVHRAALRARGVRQITGAQYVRIDDDGLHLTVPGETGSQAAEAPREDLVLAVDSVILCAGQVSQRELAEPLEQAGVPVHIIGGADVAAELDAKRAIKQGVEVAAAL